jgi:hypothetical protein
MAIMIKKKVSGSQGPKWLKTGAAAKALIKEQEQKEALREEKRGRLYRHWMPPKSETPITFIDGALDDEGMLGCVVFMEHQVQIGNDYRNWFTCIAEDEPCPLCQDEVSTPYLAGALTIIDHGEYENKEGKTFKNQKRLFVFKRRTMELLVEYAKEYGGLNGTTWVVKRTAADVANVGDVFLFKKKRSIKELQEKYPDVDWSPANYEKELPYHTAKELREMGYGSSPVGAESTEESTDVDDEL